MEIADLVSNGEPAKVNDKIASLPAEIRNQIMELVLVPGAVYLPNSPEVLQSFYISLQVGTFGFLFSPILIYDEVCNYDVTNNR